ncbi:Recombination protein RecU [Streptococcus sp. HSISB1]|nr:Recombination protein RecU [Streptococcus sp. HSISB1]
MPLKNFHAHQIEHMEHVLKQDGICFVLLHFSTIKETYYLPASALVDFYQINLGTKSMPLDYIRKNGYMVTTSSLPQVPYLDIIDQKILGGDHN